MLYFLGAAVPATKPGPTKTNTGGCPGPFKLFGKYCIYFSQDKQSWSGANKFCQESDGQLVEIRTAEKMDAIIEAKIKAKIDHIMFFGLKDSWKWATSEEPLKYTNWDKEEKKSTDDEPNNLNGNQKCVQLRINNKWDDTECETNNFFMCEKI